MYKYSSFLSEDQSRRRLPPNLPTGGRGIGHGGKWPWKGPERALLVVKGFTHWHKRRVRLERSTLMTKKGRCWGEWRVKKGRQKIEGQLLQFGEGSFRLAPALPKIFALIRRSVVGKPPENMIMNCSFSTPYYSGRAPNVGQPFNIWPMFEHVAKYGWVPFCGLRGGRSTKRKKKSEQNIWRS